MWTFTEWLGANEDTVQRFDVFEGLGNLEPGETYFLAAHAPGFIVRYQEFDALRDRRVPVWLQSAGRAESDIHLALNFANPIGL